MHTYFISDLHLDEQQPKKLAVFLKFLQIQAKEADALYILGDLFEAWVGDDVITPLVEQVKKALYQLSLHGVPVFFMPGNRDFLIGRQFTQAADIELLEDPTVINLYGQRVLLLHGDTLCTEDKAYLRFRRFVRHPLFRSCFLALPLRFRQYLAQRARQKSQAYTAQAEKTIMDVSKSSLKTLARLYRCEVIIHGHTHRPSIGEFTIDIRKVKHFVLSDWDHEGNALSCNELSEFRLTNF